MYDISLAQIFLVKCIYDYVIYFYHIKLYYIYILDLNYLKLMSLILYT